MMPRKGQRQERGAAQAVLFVGLLWLLAPAAMAATTHEFGNGISATIHTVEDVEAALVHVDQDRAFLMDAGGEDLVLDTSPSIWHPFDAAVVINALAAMSGFHAEVEVDVYLLPAPPADVGSSFSRRDAIFLAPGFGPVVAETVASITTHEMGHVLTWARLDGRPERWDAYSTLRGLDPDVHHSLAIHALRPREILAEDLRHLFGGALATHTGTIENSDLPLPGQVAGLRALLVGFLNDPGHASPAMCVAYPNPCNPRTTIHMSLPAGSAFDGGAMVEIYDVRGARVRTLRGGQADGDGVSVVWDGRGDRGGAVASGRYMYVIRADGQLARGAVTLIR